MPLGVVNNRERLLTGIQILLSNMYGKRFQVRISGGAVYDVTTRVDQLDMTILAGPFRLQFIPMLNV